MKTQINHILFLITMFIQTIAILISESCALNIIYILLTMLNIYIFDEIHLKKLFYFVVFLTPLILSTTAVSFIFATASPIDIAMLLVSRTAALSLVSFIYACSTDYEQVLYDLMQLKIMPLKFGYSLIATKNATIFLFSEWKRIVLVYQARYFHHNIAKIFIKSIYPLLISAVRYSHTTSLSFNARGLVLNKTFRRRVTKWSKIENTALFVNITFIVLLNYLFYS